jgi:hypothetical protein
VAGVCKLLPNLWEPQVDLFRLCVETGDSAGAAAALAHAQRLAPSEPKVQQLAQRWAERGGR